MFHLKKLRLGLILLIFLLAQFVLAQEQSGRLLVERIDILGARKTKPQVIHRYLSFREGQALTPELIEHDQQALLATNFFKRVDFSTAPGSEKGKVIVIIELQERRLPTLEFAGGYSELDGWYFSPLGLRYDNLLGTGHFLGVRMLVGDQVGGVNFRFRQPHLFGGSMNFQFDFEVLNRNVIHYLDARKVIQKVGIGTARFTLSGTRGMGKFLAGGYQIGSAEPDSSAKFTNNDSLIYSFPPDIAKNLGKKELGIFWLRLQADTRDNMFFPRRGLWGALSLEVADRQFGGNTQFTRTIFDGRFYQNIGHSVLALRLKAAATSTSTPYYERFYLGGAYSLRGFAERSLTPIGYGTQLVLANLEWRMPIASRNPQKPSLMGVVFFDAGGIGTPQTKINKHDILTAVGFGFRLNVPILGLLRCDFAYPQKSPDDFRFHFAIGHPF
ncbi:MAG: BamA/TamA family outer membrane protein [candidate division KSB1 bacterium]|nr:BamA/TamA family outer membrane protein [candidate division KSB1 bacterium]